VRVHDQASALRLASMACPALPTCGLALAESERFLPELLGRVEGLLSECGLAGEEVTLRMTGCPNGCVRPYMAEIGFVGRAPGRYQLLLGGNASSTRLNRVFRENVKEAEIVDTLRPVLSRYASERAAGEGFWGLVRAGALVRGRGIGCADRGVDEPSTAVAGHAHDTA
jgi:sulfite reductase (NADPH) hemoprotein beta-component